MKLFMCFGGAAAVADDEAAAAARRRSLSFRGKFLPGNKGSKKKSPRGESMKGGMDADDVVYGGVLGLGPSTASSVASSALLSSAASLDSGYSSSSSSSSRSSTASSSASVSGVLFPPAKKGSSPAAGAAAVVLCLLMVVFCGRVGATLLTSAALYLSPRRWPGMTHGKEKDGVNSLESDAEEETGEEEGGYGSGVLDEEPQEVMN